MISETGLSKVLAEGGLSTSTVSHFLSRLGSLQELLELNGKLANEYGDGAAALVKSQISDLSQPRHVALAGAPNRDLAAAALAALDDADAFSGLYRESAWALQWIVDKASSHLDFLEGAVQPADPNDRRSGHENCLSLPEKRLFVAQARMLATCIEFTEPLLASLEESALTWVDLLRQALSSLPVAQPFAEQSLPDD